MPELAQRLRERIIGFGQGRLQRYGAPQRRAGSGPTALAEANQAEVIVQLGILRRHREALLKPTGGSGEPLGSGRAVEESSSRIEIGRRVVGSAAGRLGVVGQRLLHLPLAGADHAQKERPSPVARPAAGVAPGEGAGPAVALHVGERVRRLEVTLVKAGIEGDRPREQLGGAMVIPAPFASGNTCQLLGYEMLTRLFWLCVNEPLGLICE